MAARLAENEVFFHRLPTEEEAHAMANEEWQDIREKYGWTADFRYGWRWLQGAIGGLQGIMPKGRAKLSVGLHNLFNRSSTFFP